MSAVSLNKTSKNSVDDLALMTRIRKPVPRIYETLGLEGKAPHAPLENCSICLQEMDLLSPLDRIQGRPCHPQHVFHAECITQWAKVGNTCPLCREVDPNAVPQNGIPPQDPAAIQAGYNLALDMFLANYNPARDFISDEIRDHLIARASHCGSIEYLRLLLSMRQGRNGRISLESRSRAILCAAASGHFECLRTLLESGPVPNAIKIRAFEFARICTQRSGLPFPEEIEILLTPAAEEVQPQIAQPQPSRYPQLNRIAMAALVLMGAVGYVMTRLFEPLNIRK